MEQINASTLSRLFPHAFLCLPSAMHCTFFGKLIIHAIVSYPNALGVSDFRSYLVYDLALIIVQMLLSRARDHLRVALLKENANNIT